MIIADSNVLYISIITSSLLFIWAAYVTVKLFSPGSRLVSLKRLLEMEKEVNRYRMAIASKDVRIGELEGKDDPSGEKADNEKILIEKEDEIKRLKYELAGLVSEAESKSADRSGLESLENELKNARAELSKKDSEMNLKQEEIDGLVKQLKSASLSKEQEASSPAEIEEIKRSMESIAVELESKKNELASKDAELRAMKERMDAAEADREQQASCLELAEELKKDLAAKQTEIESLNAELVSARETSGKDRNEYKAHLEKIGAESAAREQDLRSREDEITRLKGELDSAKTSGGDDNSLMAELEGIERKMQQQAQTMSNIELQMEERLAMLDKKSRENIEKVAQTAGSIEFEAFRKMVHLDEMESRYRSKTESLERENEELKKRLAA